MNTQPSNTDDNALLTDRLVLAPLRLPYARAVLDWAFDLFGQPEDAIPNAGAGRVDVEAIIQLSKR